MSRSMPVSAPVDRRRQRGFTLLELLVVIAILGLLAALVAPRVMTLFGNAKQKIAAQSIGQLTDVLEFYRLDVGAYPSTDQGLDALVAAPSGVANWHGPYLKDGKAPVDPWGRPFQYRNPSARTGLPFDICSYGASGQPGGSGENATVCNSQ
ncbi:MAG: gspG [Rhodospirillales bacterium]|nr:gspG [Rhodospirillales bacterium]